ncbi:MAG: hypothetical protein QNJ98_14830 [Planctomycetota bacterium]|nr:hypothetical protein [Planctomycetota bacterium]
MSSSSAIRLAALLVLVPILLLVFVLPLMMFGFDSPGQGPGGDFARSEFDWWGVWSRKGASGREDIQEMSYPDIEAKEMPRMPDGLATLFRSLLDVINHVRIAVIVCGVLALLALLLPGRQRLRGGVLATAGFLLVGAMLYLRFGFDFHAREYWGSMRSGPFAGDNWTVGLFRTELMTPGKQAWLVLPIGPIVLLGTSLFATIVGFVGLRRSRRKTSTEAAREPKPRRERRPIPKKPVLVFAIVAAVVVGLYLLVTGSYRGELSEIEHLATTGPWKVAVDKADRYAREYGPDFLHAGLDHDHVFVRMIAADSTAGYFDRWNVKRDPAAVDRMTAHLIRKLADVEQVRSEVATALVFVKKGWDDALVDALDHEEATVRVGVIRTIGRGRALKPPKASEFRDPLLRMLDDPAAAVRRETAIALLMLDEPPVGHFPTLLPLVLEALELASRAEEAAFRAIPDLRLTDTRDTARLELEMPARQASVEVGQAERALERFWKTTKADKADVLRLRKTTKVDEADVARLRDQLQGGTEAQRVAAAAVLTRLAPEVALDAPEVYALLVKLYERELLGPQSRRLVDEAVEALKRAGAEGQLMSEQVREATGR